MNVGGIHESSLSSWPSPFRPGRAASALPLARPPFAWLPRKRSRRAANSASDFPPEAKNGTSAGLSRESLNVLGRRMLEDERASSFAEGVDANDVVNPLESANAADDRNGFERA
jgi:hypothetical protein